MQHTAALFAGLIEDGNLAKEASLAGRWIRLKKWLNPEQRVAKSARLLMKVIRQRGVLSDPTPDQVGREEHLGRLNDQIKGGIALKSKLEKGLIYGLPAAGLTLGGTGLLMAALRKKKKKETNVKSET